MHSLILQKLVIFLVLIVGVTGQAVFASVLTLDDFSQYQRISDEGDRPGSTSDTINGLAGSDLLNLSRTFIGEATTSNSGSKITIKSQNGLLKIANGPASAGHASIQWDFDPVDFTKFGTGMLLEVVRIDLNVSAEIIVNGVAGSGTKTFTGADDFLVHFNDFSNNGVFSNVSSIRLNFSGPLAWDGQFKLLMDGTPLATVTSVPVPTAYLMMASGLLGLLGISRNKPL
jgi:hypothetical protein